VSGPDPGWDDDDRLVAELGDAVRAGREVPERFVDVGRGAFAWHGVDLELAALAFDSAGTGLPAGVRSGDVAIRAMSFEGGGMTIEVELSPQSLAGQVVPPRPGTVELWENDAASRSTALDEDGWFDFGPRPTGPFRLCVRAGGETVVTARVTP
jgi:hypothetical protein